MNEQLTDDLIAFIHRHYVAPFWLFAVARLKHILSIDTNKSETTLSMIQVDKYIRALLNVIWNFDIFRTKSAIFSCPLKLSMVFSFYINFFSILAL